MNLNHTYDGEILLIYLSGDMDHYNIIDIRKSTDDMIEWYKPKTLVLDYNKVTFMDSAGIGFLLGRTKKMRTIGGSVTISNVNENIERILHLACVDKYAKIV